jgi:PadR family transcriptional regulator, regulatory protein PadR
MAKDTAGCLQGALDLLVLKTLESCGRMHGYGITVHIQSRSEDALRIEEGSLYPALHRMEQAGWIRAEWGATENKRRARFYTITAAGRKQLSAEQDKWMAVAGAVERFLRYA